MHPRTDASRERHDHNHTNHTTAKLPTVRQKSASPRGVLHRPMKKSPNKTAARKEEQVASIVVGLGSPAVTTLIQESVDQTQALQSRLVCVDSASKSSGLGSPMMSLFVSLGRY